MMKKFKCFGDELDLRSIFEDFSSKLFEETMIESSPSLVYSNKYYRQIISLGDKIIPHLISDLENGDWYNALSEITGVNPIKEENVGYVSKMNKDWRDWYANSNNRYKRFLKENKDIIEFPIKKFMSLIKSRLEGTLILGENKYTFDFTKEIQLPISFILIVNYMKGKSKYGGYINEDDVIKYNYNGFKLNINIEDNIIDYIQLYSIINHELKHVYDLYYNESESMGSVTGYNMLKIKYFKNKWILHFLELSNLALKHELDARLSMIYDKLRWLHTFDRDQLKSEFKKTYVFKSLDMLNKFNYLDILNNIDEVELIKFTNDFLMYFMKSNSIVNTKNGLIGFYNKVENIFKDKSKLYLNKCEDVLDELVRDKRQYIENRQFIIGDNYRNISESYINDVICEIFGDVSW